MRSVIKNYLAMIAFAVVAVLVIGAIGVRIDRDQEADPIEGISATPAITGETRSGLVDAQWLLGNLDQVDYILDLGDQRQYDLGHIPNAHHIWWQDAMSAHASNYSEPDKISQLASGTGVFGFLNLHIPQDAHVVIYDSNGSERATWLLWVMQINGYTDVQVLDGGLAAWIGAGGELTTDAAPAVDDSIQATPTTDTAFLVKTEGVSNAINDGTKIIDTRDSEQMQDTVNGTTREGHIPGAINILTADVMREDGTFKSAADLREIFEANGISPDDDVIVYSLFAHQSGNMWLALHIADYDNVRIYQEGYAAWGQDASLPIETDSFQIPEPIASPAASPVVTPVIPEPTPTEEPTDLT
ncbi:MAG: sulfurtransferase [Thermomicrobiales bacterium]|nr:sulfurtransferase [Thermomicrobiales bacterium]